MKTTFGTPLSRSEMKNVTGGKQAQACSMTYQDSSGKWQIEQGTCTTIVSPGRVTTVTNYCKTDSFQGPTTLSSNGGVSKCGATK